MHEKCGGGYDDPPASPDARARHLNQTEAREETALCEHSRVRAPHGRRAVAHPRMTGHRPTRPTRPLPNTRRAPLSPALLDSRVPRVSCPALSHMHTPDRQRRRAAAAASGTAALAALSTARTGAQSSVHGAATHPAPLAALHKPPQRSPTRVSTPQISPSGMRSGRGPVRGCPTQTQMHVLLPTNVCSLQLRNSDVPLIAIPLEVQIPRGVWVCGRKRVSSARQWISGSTRRPACGAWTI